MPAEPVTPTAAAAPDSPPAPSDGDWDGIDRRHADDRRARPTRFWDSLIGPRRRSRGRRQSDHEGLYVDVYHKRDIALVLAIFLLNIADALLTLRFLDHGGTEANPLMQQLLDLGRETFLYEKCFLVGFWLVLLVVHKNFRLARVGLWLLLAGYTVLLGYHLTLLAYTT